MKHVKPFEEFIGEAYDGNLEDFKYDIELAIEDLGLSTKAIKKVTKKGKGYEVRMSSYMSQRETWEKIADKIGSNLVDFTKGNINVGVFESVVNEAKYDKKKLLKLIKNHDDAEILVNGKWYIIYNPDNGNDENTKMWAADDYIYALDPDGEEFQIKYKDIEQFKESVEVNEAKATKADFDKVVKVLKKSKYPMTVMFVPKWNEIEIITGWDTPDRIIEDIFDRLDGAGIQSGGNSGISISGDSSSYSRREYESIERINGGHRNY